MSRLEGQKDAAPVALPVGPERHQYAVPREPIGPLPASGARTQFDFCTVFHMGDGKIAECWFTWDNMTILRQFGHIPV
jgi:SnoaL-like polyketide cyclase